VPGIVYVQQAGGEAFRHTLVISASYRPDFMGPGRRYGGVRAAPARTHLRLVTAGDTPLRGRLATFHPDWQPGVQGLSTVRGKIALQGRFSRAQARTLPPALAGIGLIYRRKQAIVPHSAALARRMQLHHPPRPDDAGKSLPHGPGDSLLTPTALVGGLTMPKTESLQHKLDRIRRPRVHITYDVEIGGAIEMKELPFVVGVLADLSGKPEEPLPRLKDRKFVEIDRDNFNKVLAATKPRLAFQVDNTLQNDGSKLNVELRFNDMDDFVPDQVVKQIEPLRLLLEARERLEHLMNKMDGNDRLEQILQDVVRDTDSLKRLQGETGRGGVTGEEK
jgi:type VI secretion system protein ImpB